MIKKIVICGTGEFSDIVTDLMERVLQGTVAAYVLDDEYITSSEYNGKPVIALSKLKEEYPPEEYDAAIGFVGREMFNQRERVFHLLRNWGYKLENLIHPSAILSTEHIGCGNIIFENCVLGFHVQFGSGNIMWPLSAINHHGIIGDFNNISPGVSTSGDVTIGSHCFLGNNSTYKNKVMVADYTYVGAGAYIAGDTEAYSVYVPERSIRLDKKSTDFL